MREWQLTKHGSPTEALELVDAPDPELRIASSASASPKCSARKLSRRAEGGMLSIQAWVV